MTTLSDRPEIMAIGDSLYQGVRSLTFTSELGRFSPPAQVAQVLSVPMTTPNPRIPVLFDLEAMLRQGGIVHLLTTIRDAALQNLQFWQSGEQWSQHEAFDNIAIGGATIESLFRDTDAIYWPRVEKLAADLKLHSLPDAGVIGSLWFALNVCFTLNPGRTATQRTMTAIDQVAARKPRILLVNIGSNEGLFHAAFTGSFDDATLNGVKSIPEKMKPLAEALKSLPPEIDTIVFNSLVRPRTAANLMTRKDFPTPTNDAYFDFYVPRIGDVTRNIPGSTVKAFDELTKGVNDQVAALMKSVVGPRLKFVDLYQASTEFDGKHYEKRFLEVQPDGDFHRLRNVPLNVLFGSFVAGGLFGLDNMHPTVPGYALIADRVLEALGSGRRTDKDKAFQNDSLLNDLPLSLILMLELSLLGVLGVFSGDDGLTS